MSNFFGFIVCTVIALGAVAALFRVGINDGDALGDAIVRVRLMRAPHPDGMLLFAELEVDNQNDSPVMVSARVCRASTPALLFIEPHGRRTAIRHRDRLGAFELLGAVDGRGAARFLLPAEAADSPRARALRVTAVVDQVGRRTRVITTVVRVSRALDAVLPGAGQIVPGR